MSDSETSYGISPHVSSTVEIVASGTPLLLVTYTSVLRWHLTTIFKRLHDDDMSESADKKQKDSCECGDEERKV
jgi:hypothetical protein